MVERENVRGARPNDRDRPADPFIPLRPGTRILDYRIEAMLGAGGFGVTYKVVDEALGKIFALKEYYPRNYARRTGEFLGPNASGQSTFEWGLNRFITEAKILASFNHAAIVGVSRIF